MKIFFTIFAIVIAIAVVLFNKDKRAVFYLLGTLFIPGYFNGAHILLPVAFVISLFYHGELERNIKKFPLKHISIYSL